MQYFCSIYILIVIFSGNEGRAFVRCVARLLEDELVHLSRRLDGFECLKLVEAVYEVTPSKSKRNGVITIGGRNRIATIRECLTNLERWNDDFPNNGSPNGRATMEMTLRWLGRPDLASYIRTNSYHLEDSLRFRRHALQNGENKDKNNNIKKKMKRKKTNDRLKSKKPRKAQNKHHMKKKENERGRGRSTVCCAILVVFLFIAMLLTAVYFYRKRNRSKRTRFKYARSVSGRKEDKDTFTDHFPDETCQCSDVEGGCTVDKCDACDSERSFARTKKRRSKRTKIERKGKGLGSMLRRSLFFGKREKDQENLDRKRNSLEIDRKRGKYLSKEQCACCRCVLDSRDKMLREKYGEKRAFDRWKRRKARRNKKRLLDKRANVCFESTCN